MSRNGVYRNGHVPKRPARPAPPEQNSGDSSRIAMSASVAKLYSHFKVSNVNKFAIVLRNRLNSTRMLFLSMYTFIILIMRVCEQRNSCRKEVYEARSCPYNPPTQLHTHTDKGEGNHVTYLSLFVDYQTLLVSNIISDKMKTTYLYCLCTFLIWVLVIPHQFLLILVYSLCV